MTFGGIILAYSIVAGLWTFALRALGMGWLNAATAVLGCSGGFVILAITFGYFK